MYVKIGVAKNPISRMRSMQTGQPTKLVILAVADWNHAFERRIHNLLRAARVEGEWFVRNEKIDSLIKHMQSGVESPEIWLASFCAPARLAKVLNIAR